MASKTDRSETEQALRRDEGEGPHRSPFFVLKQTVRGFGDDVYDRAIDVTISRLRRKMSPDDLIRTVRNEGYMFVLNVQR